MNELLEYAKSMNANVDIMRGPEGQERMVYLPAVERWRARGYVTVVEIRVVVEVLWL